MDVHWRNTQKTARFFGLDARAFVAVLILLLHFRTYTMVFTAMVILVFYIQERRGLSFDSAIRAFKCWLMGKNRPANSRRGKRRWIDFG